MLPELVTRIRVAVLAIFLAGMPVLALPQVNDWLGRRFFGDIEPAVARAEPRSAAGMLADASGGRWKNTDSKLTGSKPTDSKPTGSKLENPVASQPISFKSGVARPDTSNPSTGGEGAVGSDAVDQAAVDQAAARQTATSRAAARQLRSNEMALNGVASNPTPSNGATLNQFVPDSAIERLPPAEFEVAGAKYGRLQARLRELGADYWRLETTGAGAAAFRFECHLPLPDHDSYSRSFTAESTDPLDAMQRVVAQVETWQTAQTARRTGGAVRR